MPDTQEFASDACNGSGCYLPGLELARVVELMLIILGCLCVAFVAGFLSLGFTLYVSDLLGLGNIGILLSLLITSGVAVWAFVWSLKRVREYMSN